MEQEQSKFEGWAIVDVMGKQRYTGFVRTEAFGGAALFRVDVPELPGGEAVLRRPEYVDGCYCPAGTKVLREATVGYTKYIGANSIYMLSPCSELAAMTRLELDRPAPIKVIEMPVKQLVAADADDEEDEDDDTEDHYRTGDDY